MIRSQSTQRSQDFATALGPMRRYRARALAVLTATLLLAGWMAPRTVCAQFAGQGIPGAGYFIGMNALAEGQYSDAQNAFSRALTGANRVGQTRWIDSICYYAMIGECEYRKGNNSLALENFAAALNLYRQNADWMVRLQFPAGVQASSNQVLLPWGKSNRGVRQGAYPDSVNLQVGSLTEAEQAVRRGGAVVQPRIFAVNPHEVVRCTCLAIKRRRDILGPLVLHDPLTEEVMATAARRLGPPNHWSAAWLDLLHGFAYSAGNRGVQAEGFLKNGLLTMGQYDHPLTGMALVELGTLAMQTGDYKTAAAYLEEATYSAAAYEDWLSLEEAFRQLHTAYMLAGEPAAVAKPITLAIAWNRNRRRELSASLTLLSAESLAVTGQVPQATALLNEVRTAIGRREMANTAIGGRLNYLTALTSYQRGAVAAGDQALVAAMRWQRSGGSKWLFQIDQADKLIVANPGGRFSARVALVLYEGLLRDPSPLDWAARPMEALAVLSTPHPLPYEHWLETALGVGASNADLAVEVADLARRHRFFSTLHLGGRTLALRWVLEAPLESLDNAARLQRQELITRYPKYAELSKQARQLRSQATTAGLSAEAESAAQRESTQRLNELATIATAQEVMLREMALRREPADMVFPPVRKIKDVQKALPNGTALLVFFTTSRGTYAWMYGSGEYTHWRVENPALLASRTTALLRSIGNFDGTRELPEQDLADTSWKESARELTDAIFGDKIRLNEELKELVVVPDGLLWYLPFEMLPHGDEEKPLIATARVRYVPTVGLSLSQQQGRKTTADYGVVVGKLHPNDTDEHATTALADMKRVAPGALPLKAGSAAPSPVVGAMLDGVIVFDDIASSKETYDWTPLPIDRAKTSGGLSAWLALPWKQVDQFILPGFHTAAENALKQTPPVPGSELFLSSTALMATGARTALVSRWRMGGQSTIDLIREFVQELPHESASAAWQRSVQLLWQTPLDAGREARIRRSNNVEPINSEHPFLWAGYLLIDSGASPSSGDDANQPIVQAPGQ